MTGLPVRRSSSLLRWALFGAYLALTILLSSLTRPPVAEAVSDTMLHAIEFTLMAILLIQALGQGLFKRHDGRHLLITAVFGISYGAADEIHQYFTPGRHSSVKDAIVDAAATLVTVAVTTLLGFLFKGRARRASEAPAAPPRVELLTREGCHLCEEARDVLASVLGPAGQGFVEIDVDADASLVERFGEEVPVVLLDGIKRFKGRVDAARLRRLLSESPRLRGKREERGSGSSEAGRESTELEPRRSPLGT